MRIESVMASLAGPSPRGRGTHEAEDMEKGESRSIPAWAGNTGPRATRRTPRPVHPRVGGEHAQQLTHPLPRVGPSPRGRGTPFRGTSPQHATRSIPAWAGNTARPSKRTRTRPVHPRVGGEHAVSSGKKVQRYGPSPRGRGTHRMGRCRHRQSRSIPAWAGNTGPGRGRRDQGPVHPRVGGEHSSYNTMIQNVFFEYRESTDLDPFILECCAMGQVRGAKRCSTAILPTTGARIPRASCRPGRRGFADWSHRYRSRSPRHSKRPRR